MIKEMGKIVDTTRGKSKETIKLTVKLKVKHKDKSTVKNTTKVRRISTGKVKDMGTDTGKVKSSNCCWLVGNRN